jgi:hypothetical protein
MVNKQRRVFRRSATGGSDNRCRPPKKSKPRTSPPCPSESDRFRVVRPCWALASRLTPPPRHDSGLHEFGDWVFQPEQGSRRRPSPKFPNRNADRLMQQSAQRDLGSRRRGGCAGRSRKGKDYLLCGDEPRLPVDKCRDSRTSC